MRSCPADSTRNLLRQNPRLVKQLYPGVPIKKPRCLAQTDAVIATPCLRRRNSQRRRVMTKAGKTKSHFLQRTSSRRGRPPFPADRRTTVRAIARKTLVQYQLNRACARAAWGGLSKTALHSLKELTQLYALSVEAGELQLLEGRWYVTHSGLLRIAQRKQCSGIITIVQARLSDPGTSRWVFKATVYKSRFERLDVSNVPFTSACCVHFLFAAIPLSRRSSLLGYIDQGETRSVCSETDAPVRQARSTLL